MGTVDKFTYLGIKVNKDGIRGQAQKGTILEFEGRMNIERFQ